MKTIWRCTPLTLIFWSTLAPGQAPPQPPPPPAPSVPPAPAVPPLGVTPPPDAAPSVSPAPEAPAAPLDQGPDTLPSLEEALTPPPTPPVVSVVSVTRRPLPPVRAERRLALLGELGWNGLAGFGVNVSYHAHPQLTFDLGVGLAVVGGKLGLRARYNLLDNPVTPFVGVGLLGATGFEAPTRDIAAEDENRELNIKLEPSAFLQTVAGLDWTSRTGFTLVSAVGHARLLTHDNVVIITGEPTEEEKRGFAIAFRSGVVISLAIGYSFR